MMLPNEVTLNGKVERKEQFGMASVHDENKTFTGNVLFKSQVRGSYDDSVETKWEKNGAILDGIVIWNTNGEVPFSDMLLDFVQIGVIDLETAERSAAQREKDDKVAMDQLYVNDEGRLVWDSIPYRDERMAKLAEVA